MPNEKRIPGLAPIKVERVAFGVRFQPHFGILDCVGSVIDRILRSSGSPFGPSTFPLSTREAGGRHSLLNPQTGDEPECVNENETLVKRI